MTLEQETFQRIVQLATKEQRKYIVENLSTTLLEKELNRRNIETVNVYNEIMEVLNMVSEEMTYNDMRDFIKKMKEVVALKPKKKVIKEEHVIEEIKEEVNESATTQPNVSTEQ